MQINSSREFFFSSKLSNFQTTLLRSLRMVTLLQATAVLVLVAHMAGAATCPHDALKQWQTNYNPGDRALSIGMYPVTGNHDAPGHTAQINCFTKGTASADEVLDPYVRNTIAGAVQAYTSKMPCQLFNDPGFLWNANINGARGADKGNGTELLNGTVASGVNANATDGCGNPVAAGTCAYPNPAMNSWGGNMFKLSQINWVPMSYSQNDQYTNNLTHYPVKGGSSSSCETSNGEIMYNGGMVVESNPIAELTYRSFMFKNEAERQAALADSGNKGLQYAKQMKGANGCDAEVVYEIKPKPGQCQCANSTVVKPAQKGRYHGGDTLVANDNIGSPCTVDYCDQEVGRGRQEWCEAPDPGNPCFWNASHDGGLNIEISIVAQPPFDDVNSAASEAYKEKVTSTMTAYVDRSSNELVVNLDKTALREAKGLPVRTGGCDAGDFTAMRFSTQFICKNTGQRVNATSFKWSDSEMMRHTLSENASDPSVWNAPYPNGTKRVPNKNNNGQMEMSGWFILVDREVAPASCGTFYWDPLIAATEGDGRGASAGALMDITTSSGHVHAPSVTANVLAATGIALASLGFLYC